MVDLLEHAYFPSNTETHLYENFNIGTINLVSVPTYDSINTDLDDLRLLKTGIDKTFKDINDDKKYQLDKNVTTQANLINTKENTFRDKNKTTIDAHNNDVDRRNTEYDTLVTKKLNLEKQFKELNDEFKIKVAKIEELANKLIKLKRDNMEAVRRIKAQIVAAKQEYRAAVERLVIQRDLLNIEIKKYNDKQEEISAKNVKIKIIETKFQEQTSKVLQLNVMLDKIAKDKVALDSEYNMWVGKFVALEEKFKKIEDEISTYLRKGENNLEYITALLDEKRIVQDKLFAYSEDKYNSQSHLIDDINSELTPSDLLENNQQREITKNSSKFSKLKNDIMSISKNILIKKNEYRKKSFYIFLLTNIFIFLIISLIIVFLMKRNYI
jgi:hypothetical protein